MSVKIKMVLFHRPFLFLVNLFIHIALTTRWAQQTSEKWGKDHSYYKYIGFITLKQTHLFSAIYTRVMSPHNPI